MNRLYLAAMVALGAAGCAAELDYVEPEPVRVTVAPPALRYEAPLACYNGTWVGGHWAWHGGWRWRPGFCAAARPGYVWIAPRYHGGVYLRGYWSRGPARLHVPPPAPAYR